MTDPHFPSSADSTELLALADSLEPCSYATGIAFNYKEFRMIIDALRHAAGATNALARPDGDMRQASTGDGQILEAAVGLAPATATNSRSGDVAQAAEVRQATIEECANLLAREYPDNANTNAFCAAIRSLAAQPPAAPVETEEWVEVTDGTTKEGDRFSYIPNPETGVGQITSHKRRVQRSSADSKDKRNQAERLLNDAMDYIAATLEQPGDIRAWHHLLIYCPREAIERRLQKLNLGERHDAFLAPERPANEVQRRLSVCGGSESGGENPLEHEPNRNARAGVEVPAGGLPQVAALTATEPQGAGK